MIRVAIFDCDGTLVDSGAAIYEAIGRTFAEMGLEPPSRSAGRRVIGLSLAEAMARLAPVLDPAGHHELAERYKRHFQAMRAGGEVAEPLYPGILDLLDSLEASGWLLAVATGKSDRGLRYCLEGHGIHPRFISLQTAERHPGKPHPSMIEQILRDTGAAPESSLMIGDTSFDMLMARAAGAVGVGVAWGYHDHSDLIEAGARLVAESPGEIARFAERMVEEQAHG